MAVFRRTNPIDLDLKIDAFQDYLFTNLSIDGLVNLDDWNCYDRIYANPNDQGLIPERYVKGKEYDEVFYNDKFKMTSFFYASPDRPKADGGMVTAEVSLVVQANILEIFTTVPHRADEELKNAFILLSESYYFAEDFEWIGVREGISNVYSEFEKDGVKYHDMSEKNVIRLRYKVRYTPQCCTDC